MGKGSITFHVNKPPAEAFSYLSDLENAPEWVPDLISVEKVTPGAIGVGTQYNEMVKMGSKEAPAKLEVTAYEPGKLFAHKGEGGPSRFTGSYSFEQDGNGTKVVHDYTVELSGFSKLFSPFVMKWVQKNAAAGIENLQAKLN